MEEKKSKKKIIFFLIAIGLLILVVIGFILYRNQKEKYDNDNIKPVIYCKEGTEIANNPIYEEKAFSDTIEISWTKDCIGTIKKEGEEISKENKTILKKEGTYEVTVTSPTGKNKETKTIIIDKTAPKAELKKTDTGSYRITFEDINDIEKATLIQADAKTEEIVKETELVKSGLIQPVIEIKEKGYYILELEDKLKNSTKDKIRFIIE